MKTAFPLRSPRRYDRPGLMDLQPLWLCVKIFTALILLRAAGIKLRSSLRFEGVLGGYKILPSATLPAAAVALPVFELLVGSALLAAPGQRWAAVAAAGLVLLFSCAMVLALARGLKDIDCGCGDPLSRQTLSWGLVVRNLLIAGGLLSAVIWEGGSSSLGALLTGIGGGVTLFLLYWGHETLSRFAKPRSREEKAALFATAPPTP